MNVGAIIAALISSAAALGVAVLAPTVFQSAKQAVERDAIVRHSLQALDGTLRNISRHFIRTGGRLINPNPVDALTLEKARINLEFVQEQVGETIKNVASSKITMGLQQIVLLLRNYNLEVDEIKKAPAIDQTRIPRILGVGLFLAQACHTAAEDIMAYRIQYAAKRASVAYSLRWGTTPMIENIDDYIEIRTIKKRKSDLLTMCDDYLDGEDDKNNRMLLQKHICETIV